MHDPDYIYNFDETINNHSLIIIHDRLRNKSFQTSINYNIDVFRFNDLATEESHIIDIVDLAVAIHTADKLSKRHGENRCHIHINLRLRNPSFFSDPEIDEMLRSILSYYTDDLWSFNFTCRQGADHFVYQSSLVSKAYDVTEVCLWSGGLDSSSGLLNRAHHDREKKFTAFGTGSSFKVHQVQQRVFELAQRQVPHLDELTQFIFQSQHNDLPTHRYYRSRGFVFLLLGAVRAYRAHQDALMIYENGIGALNLPYRPSEVGIDHSRAVHPIGLIRMSKFVSRLFGIRFRIENPFLWQTKGQMCQVFKSDNLSMIASETTSCDSRHRQPKRPADCGYCSSCILRRQSLASAQIIDRTSYCWTPFRNEKTFVALESMRFQVSTFNRCLGSKDPWIEFCREYPSLAMTLAELVGYEGQSKDVVIARFLTLFRTYVEEWNTLSDDVFNSQTEIDPSIRVQLTFTLNN